MNYESSPFQGYSSISVDDLKDQAAETIAKGDFVEFDEIAIKMWMPTVLAATELTDDDQFWKGCESCVNYPILQSKHRRNCLCTAMLFDPAHDEVKVPRPAGFEEE